YFGSSAYGITFVIVIFFSTLQFFVGSFSFGAIRGAVNDLFLQKDLVECSDQELHGIVRQGCYFNDWGDRNPPLCTFSSLPLSKRCPFPAGVVGPALTMGVFVGRIIGEILHICFAFTPDINPDPRVYAVIGAAAMMASITKTISSAVILMEITKETTLLVPMLLCVLIACGIVGAFGESFFDSNMRLRGIPMLPVMPTEMYRLATEESSTVNTSTTLTTTTRVTTSTSTTTTVTTTALHPTVHSGMPRLDELEQKEPEQDKLMDSNEANNNQQITSRL
ncbi:hypothetical protein RFI_07533, partial [Reticulomyxa filosa]